MAENAHLDPEVRRLKEAHDRQWRLLRERLSTDPEPGELARQVKVMSRIGALRESNFTSFVTESPDNRRVATAYVLREMLPALRERVDLPDWMFSADRMRENAARFGRFHGEDYDEVLGIGEQLLTMVECKPTSWRKALRESGIPRLGPDDDDQDGDDDDGLSAACPRCGGAGVVSSGASCPSCRGSGLAQSTDSAEAQAQRHRQARPASEADQPDYSEFDDDDDDDLESATSLSSGRKRKRPKSTAREMNAGYAVDRPRQSASSLSNTGGADGMNEAEAAWMRALRGEEPEYRPMSEAEYREAEYYLAHGFPPPLRTPRTAVERSLRESDIPMVDPRR